MNDNINNIDIETSSIIAALREELGLTRTYLADKVGCTPYEYGLFEKGNLRLSLSTIIKLCFILKIPRSRILDDTTKSLSKARFYKDCKIENAENS